ncbi:cytochrome B (plasmid) [Rhizobium sp. 32-5/1]|uniref:cytochrome c oxidase subunit II n=1 Tax=Rhizobium sp. 32-5/1 TaxID=3019602 RepID=UPI00240DAEE2|nr:cytochrome B [Rhizobium sp. 32-5/1]WEZ85983.1 cytochrome B [Rhizobium sp. 32-5/1]
MLHPAGPAAHAISELWWVMLACGLAIFLFVMALLFAALYRPANPSVQDRDESGTNFWMWGLGLGFPVVTLAALTLYGLFIGERLVPHAAHDLVTVQADARQWAWTFRYGESRVNATEGVLHIPAGRPVNVEITSTDVIHSFWVPRLAGKLDAIPGHVNVLRIEAARPGTYDGQSSEFSGRGYREHVFTVEAHDAASWATFLAEGTQ